MSRISNPLPGSSSGDPSGILSGASSVTSAGSSSDAIADLSEKLKSPLRDAIADTIQVSKDSLNEFVNVYAPRIAAESIRLGSPNPDEQSLARRNIEHLKAQAIMNAGSHGVNLQQRFELSLRSVVTTLISAAVAWKI